MNQDLTNMMKWGQSLAPASRTADADGAGVDFQDCGPEVTQIVNVGANGGDDTVLAYGLEESDDNSTNWTEIEGSSIAVAGDTENQVSVKTVHNRSKRYVRSAYTSTGTSDTVISGTVLVGRKISY